MPFFIKLLLAHTYIIFNLNNSCNSLPGPSLIQRFRPDLKAKFAHLFDDNTMLDYIYHCNAQTPRYIVTVNFKVNVIKDAYKNTNFVPVLKLLLFRPRKVDFLFLRHRRIRFETPASIFLSNNDAHIFVK